MVVADTTIYFGLGFLFAYLIGYRLNKFFGYMLFISLGFLLLWKGETDAAKAVGLMFTIGSFLGMIINGLQRK